MHNARFRVMAGLAGATLCLFAATASAQNPTTTTPDPNTQGTVTTPPATNPAPTDQATTPTTTTDQSTVSQTTATDATTTTTTRSFPGGTLGILAVAVVVLLLLFGLFRGRDKTIVKDTYVATPPVTGARTVTTSTTTTDDRMNLNSRAASGPGSNPGGMNDPNARR
jgi:hypothetical protein